MDLRPTLAAPDDDPYLWLEEIDGGEAFAWVDRQNAATLKRYGDASFAKDRDALASERVLYLIRKRAEHSIKFLNQNGSNRFYIPSLSSRTIV